MSSPLTVAWNKLCELIDSDKELLQQNRPVICPPFENSERNLCIREKRMKIWPAEDQMLAQINEQAPLRRFEATDDGEGHSLLQEEGNAPKSPRKVLENLLQWFVGFPAQDPWTGKKEQK
jgi:hypothetical protein